MTAVPLTVDEMFDLPVTTIPADRPATKVTVPDFFQVELEEIYACVQQVRRGQVLEIARSAGGFPIHAIAYGEKLAHTPTTNLSGYNGGGAATSYVNEDRKQVIILIAGCHGAEAEATAGCVNMIYQLERGFDLRHQTDAEFNQLLEHYRLIIIPCLNPDGRHNSPKCHDGMSREEALRVCQGVWKDGTSVGYPHCKNFQPLPPDKVQHMGGYPNADGYNIMHDATPGDIKTAEARGLLALVNDEQADLCLHLHGHQNLADILPPSAGMFDLHRKRILAYRMRMMKELQAAGIPTKDYPTPDPAATWLCPLNLASMTSMCSGALSPTFEQPTANQDFNTCIQTVFEICKLFMRHGMNEPFAPRRALCHSFYDASADLITYP